MKRSAFERLVAEAVDGLPEEFLKHLENVEILVEEWPGAEDLERAGVPREERSALLGLYVGVPLVERGAYYAGQLPDQIILFKRPIELAAGEDPAQVEEQVRRTIIHEVAHFYGISDARLEEMGWG